MNKFIGHILVVDDDDGIRNLVKQYLTENNFLITTANNAEDAKEKISIIKFDLIVLDIMMPGKTGLEFTLENKNKINTPIILLTAKGGATERIEGLETGADDYLPKPFNPRELLARVRAVLRRAQVGQGQSSDETIRYFGEFSLDLASHRLSHGDVSVPLTSGEFDLLSVLVEHPNKVMDRDRILDLLTGAERLPFDRSIDVRVTRLRSKIEADPSKPIHIRTIWGKGYMFCPNPDGE